MCNLLLLRLHSMELWARAGVEETLDHRSHLVRTVKEEEVAAAVDDVERGVGINRWSILLLIAGTSGSSVPVITNVGQVMRLANGREEVVAIANT